MKPAGHKANQVTALRLARAARAEKMLAASAAAPKATPAIQQDPAMMTKTAKSKKKSAAPKGKKRGVSEAAANLKAAKAAAKKSKPKAQTTAAEPGVKTVREGSKLEIVVKLLKKAGGTTSAEVLKETGWPSVSMPQQARAAGIEIKKEKIDGVTRYSAA